MELTPEQKQEIKLKFRTDFKGWKLQDNHEVYRGFDVIVKYFLDLFDQELAKREEQLRKEIHEESIHELLDQIESAPQDR